MKQGVIRHCRVKPDIDANPRVVGGYQDPPSSLRSCRTAVLSVPIGRVISLCHVSGRSSKDISSQPYRIPYDRSFDTVVENEAAWGTVRKK